MTATPAQTRGALAGAGSLAPLLARAAATVEATGWPSQRLEAWRYTSLRSLRDATVPYEAGAGYHVSALDAADALPLTEALADAGFAAQLGGIARVDAADDAVVARNTLDCTGGLHVQVASGADARAELSLAGDAFPRLFVEIGRGARLRLVEHHDVGGVVAPVVEVRLADDAVLEHIVLQTPRDGGHTLATVAIEVGRGASYRSHVLQLGDGLGRIEQQVRLRGDGSSCDLAGLQVGNARQHLDAHVVVDHLGEHTRSSQQFKGLFGGRSSGVFRGNVRIAREARFADAAQMNRNLLLSEQARAHTKPQLEIDNEDVKASHGATVGQLDAAQLFYLRSRGIPEAEARDLLVQAFADEIVAALPEPTLAQQVRDALRLRLSSTGEEAVH